MTIWGIDTSSHNPVTDIAALKGAGIAFNAIKRTGGTHYINPFGRAQVALHRGAGILVLHYLYFGEVDMTTGKGVDEAAWFIKEVGDDLQPGELPIVDWEEESASDIEELLACLETLEARYGVIPAIYSYPDFLARHVPRGDTRLARYPLFFASYRSSYPPCPPPWSKIVIWQYSDNETIPGVGHVDGDRFEGTIEELRAYGKRGDVNAEVVVPNSIQFGPYGKMLGGGFRKTYQDAPDGVGLYGYPVTNEITENGLTVQYFERARFEYHADTGAITFGRVGAELARLRGLSEAA